MSTIRILHLEDDVVDVDWFARAIERLAADRALTGDIEIVHCSTLDETIKYLAHQEVSVAVLDLIVPDARPTEVVERVRSAAPGVPIVVLSARGLEALRHDGLVGEVHASVCKTETSVKTLGDVLRSTIDLKPSPAPASQHHPPQRRRNGRGRRGRRHPVRQPGGVRAVRVAPRVARR